MRCTAKLRIAVIVLERKEIGPFRMRRIDRLAMRTLQPFSDEDIESMATVR